MFGLYKKINKELYGKYELLGEYADMHDLLESRVIEGRSFAEVIMDDYTELLGQYWHKCEGEPGIPLITAYYCTP